MLANGFRESDECLRLLSRLGIDADTADELAVSVEAEAD